MPDLKIVTGYSSNGLPCARIGSGRRVLVVFDGLDFSHKPPSPRMLPAYLKRLAAADYTVYQVRRKPGLPQNYSIRDMSDDYAVMIREEFKIPVDVMGISTGGPMAQCFAADYPQLVRRLVLASTGYKLNENGRALQGKMAGLVRAGKYRSASSVLADGMASGPSRLFFRVLLWLFAGSLIPGDDPSDGLVEIEAEDRHNFEKRLAEIRCPTLVIGGGKDFFYRPISFTAAGIPGAKLVLYEGVGHAAIMRREFVTDVLSFLNADTV
jgi:pimeloyl-ACP methyl ester carboxylesterase